MTWWSEAGRSARRPVVLRPAEQADADVLAWRPARIGPAHPSLGASGGRPTPVTWPAGATRAGRSHPRPAGSVGRPPAVERPAETGPGSGADPGGESPEAAFERGRAAGRDEAKAELAAARDRERERLRRAVAALDAAASGLHDAVGAAREELVDEAVRFGLEVAEAVLARELSRSPADNLKDALRRVLGAAPAGAWPAPAGDGPSGAAASVGGADPGRSTGAVVRLNPDDAAFVAEAMERRHPDRPFGRGPTFYGLLSGLRVQPDPTVERGGCVLELGAERIDGQVSQALARVRAALADALAWGSPDAVPPAAEEELGRDPLGAAGQRSDLEAAPADGLDVSPARDSRPAPDSRTAVAAVASAPEDLDHEEAS